VAKREREVAISGERCLTEREGGGNQGEEGSYQGGKGGNQRGKGG
jgi:hypothetical protein